MGTSRFVARSADTVEVIPISVNPPAVRRTARHPEARPGSDPQSMRTLSEATSSDSAGCTHPAGAQLDHGHAAHSLGPAVGRAGLIPRSS